MKEQLTDEIKDIAPILHQRQGHKEGFKKIPDNYFSDFENQLMQQIKEIEPVREATILPFYKRWASAAAIVFLIGGGLFMWQQQPNSSGIALLSPEEITSYIEDNIEEFDTELLEQELSIESFYLTDFQEEDLEVIIEELGIEDFAEEMIIEDF